MNKTFSILTSAFISLSCMAQANEPPKTRFAVRGSHELRQFVIPGFEELPLNRKLFAYYLTEAMEAGRDIAWIQLSRKGLAIRKLFENILEKRESLAASDRLAIETYYFKLIANHGIYDATTNSKNLLDGFAPETFQNLLKQLGLNPQLADGLMPDLFDPNHKPRRLAEQGKDLVADAGVNFYGPGVTQAMMEVLEPKLREHSLSYPSLSRDGKIRLEIFKKTGRFGTQLERVDTLLAKAAEYAFPDEKKLIDQYRKTILTGDPEDALEADRIWVQLKTRDLTFYIGFCETYDDPYQYRGTSEGFILLHPQDRESKAISERVRAAAPEYERNMPVADEFKKVGNFTPPQSEAAYILHFAGGNSETFFLGVNLPNDNTIRETLGSKSFTAINQVNALGEPPKSEYKDDELETFILPEYHDLLKEYGRRRGKLLQVEFHEVLGHGSGRSREGVKTDTVFGDLYLGFEESRAELASLYHMTDYETLVRHKLVPSDWAVTKAREFAEAVLLNFFSSQLESFKKLKGKTVVRQAHQLGRQVILNHLLNEGALKIVMSEKNVPRIKMEPIQTIRESLGRLWHRQQEIKSTGDAPALKTLLNELGILTPDQMSWADAIAKASEELKRPDKSVVMNPFLKLVEDGKGQITDVTIDYLDPQLGMDALAVQELRRRENDQSRAQMCRAFRKDDRLALK